jgi:organic radical activating enzyme
MTDYPGTQRRLDQISPSFCAAKWLQVTLHLHNGQTHSCHHPDTHSVPLDELKANPSALHNTSFKKSLRKMMLEGERPKECHYCWAAEDSPGNHFSDRVIKSADDWAVGELEDLARRPYDDNVNPRYVELSFSNACNFKCSYCYPNISSKILEEVKKFGDYKIHNQRQSLSYLESHGMLPFEPEEENPYIKAFWEWWPSLYPDLRVLRVTGGEPLLSPNTFRLLDKVIEAPNKNLELAINSNLGVPKSLIDRLITQMKKVDDLKSLRRLRVYTSVDSWAEQAEYIRHGLKFNEFWGNVKRVLNELPNVDLTIMSTFSSLSITRFHELLEGVLELKRQSFEMGRPGSFLIDISHLVAPYHQSILLLPKEMVRTNLEKCVNFMDQNPQTQSQAGFLDYERNKMRRLLHYALNNPAHNEEEDRGDFFRFFGEHDRRRGTDFLKTFPEFKEFWALCRKSALKDFFGSPNV